MASDIHKGCVGLRGHGGGQGARSPTVYLDGGMPWHDSCVKTKHKYSNIRTRQGMDTRNTVAHCHRFINSQALPPPQTAASADLALAPFMMRLLSCEGKRNGKPIVQGQRRRYSTSIPPDHASLPQPRLPEVDVPCFQGWSAGSF